MMIVRVSSVVGRVGKGVRESSVKGRAKFSTGRKKGLAPLDTRHSKLFFLRAFTLLELMIVVAIMGVILTIGVPIVYRMGHESALRKAVKDVVEVCSYARALAILQSKATCVVFHPREGSFAVEGGGNLTERPVSTGSLAMESNAKGSGLSGQLSDRVAIDMLDVDMTEYKDSEEVKVWFYPNGVCDELTLILHGLDASSDPIRAISLEVTTGLASVETDITKLRSQRK